MIVKLFLLFLEIVWAAGIQTITSSTGAPVGDQTNSLSSGPRGHLLLQDEVLLENLESFNRERIPERVVHGIGSGAFGYFEVTNDITRYTKAKVFSKIGKRTPVFVRFSMGSSQKGTAETLRDFRGFALKFYTEEGNWDLVGNNMPVFFFRDGIKLPVVAHGILRHPVTNLLDQNTFWDDITLNPQSIHMVMMVLSDRGIPDGFRHMNGFGVNTFKLVNEKGEAVYCKFHYKTDQGIKNILADRARTLQGIDPDYATRDLYDAIKSGNYPSWTFYIQVMTFKQAEMWYFNPFDPTKVWPQKEFPLLKVGKLVINRLPKNFFADVEQAAFCASSFVPGIEASPDKSLQGRLYSYIDTQKHRLGGNFRQFPINYPFRSPPRNYQRDGPQTVTDNQGGQVNYYPNSYGGPVENPNYRSSCFKTSGDVCKWNSTDEDNFTQPGIFYREVLNKEERQRLVDNVVPLLNQTEEFIQERAIKVFSQVDRELGQGVQDGLNQLKEQSK